MTDLAKRKEIVGKLIEASPGLGFKRPKSRTQEVKNNYSRIAAAERILEWGEGEDPEAQAIRVALNKALDELYPKLENLALVLKPLCNLPASGG